jgi:hypothetical protein
MNGGRAMSGAGVAGDERYPAQYEAGSLPNLASSIYQRLTSSDLRGLSKPLEERYRLEIDETETVVLLLIDGLGWKLLGDLAEIESETAAAEVFRSLRDRAQSLTSVFPSTTCAAMGSLVTAQPPGRHGVVGKQVFLAELGRTLNLHHPATDALAETFKHGSSPGKTVLWQPTLFESGLRSVVLTRVQFGPSIFTACMFRGATVRFYVSVGDMADSLREVVIDGAGKGPRLVLVYWDSLDTMLHVFGYRPRAAAEEVGAVFGAVARSLQSLPDHLARKTRLLVIGDHGHVEIQPGGARAIDSDVRLKELLEREAVGERRAVFLAARPSLERGLMEYLRSSLPGTWSVTPVSEAIEDALMGRTEPSAALRDRLGTALVQPGARSVWLSPNPIGPATWVPKAAHGGLSREEMLVPLISLSMEDLARL